jgi:hypothetical protein
MEINLTTPALLFPAISLLLLAFTNRFLALAALIRGLRKQYDTDHDRVLLAQIQNLNKRVLLIRNMQAFGIASLLVCVVCMFALFLNEALIGKLLFGISLVLMMVSLTLSLREILISVNALRLELSKTLEESSSGEKSA